MILLSSNETTQLPTKISFGHTHTCPQARGRLPSPPPAPPMSSMGSGAASSLHTDDATVSSLGTAGMHVRRSQGSPVGDSFTRLITMPLPDRTGCRRNRYVQQHNCIVNMETHTTWCVRSTLVINMVIRWSLQATCLETGRRTAAPVEFGRPSVFEPAELPLSGTGRLTDCQKQCCSSSDTTRPATCLKSGLPAPAFGSTLCSKCSRVQCHRV